MSHKENAAKLIAMVLAMTDMTMDELIDSAKDIESPRIDMSKVKIKPDEEVNKPSILWDDEEIPQNVNLGEKYNPAMLADTEEEAQHYLEKCIAHSLKYSEKPLSYDDAKNIELSNIGYYAGYGFDMNKINRLYKTVHPIFG